MTFRGFEFWIQRVSKENFQRQVSLSNNWDEKTTEYYAMNKTSYFTDVYAP